MNHSDTTTDGHHQKKMHIKLTSDKNLCHPIIKVKLSTTPACGSHQQHGKQGRQKASHSLEDE